MNVTPKEKAKELILKFAFKGAQHEGEAKRFALISVDEILKNNPHSTPTIYGVPPHSTMKYWQEVKHEIEKL